MSSKRKDSHPSKATPSKDGEEVDKSDECMDQGPWSAFAPLGSGLHKPPGLPMSQLGHLLSHNGHTEGTSPGRSEMSREDSIIADDASSTGNKEDDDDDEEEDDEVGGMMPGDPEKLKAFNMFVRLFVDENLDRHVPISKQPKEKIQAIIDSCTRQFPEYSNRGRKRIRTYLKSCRRTKRSREQAGLDTNNKPTPPHLTSVHAEQLLARACENEAENAKRMRLGVEPISQSMPAPVITNSPIDVLAGTSPVSLTSSDKLKLEYKPEQLATLLAASQHQQTSAPNIATVNGATAAMYRQAFQTNPSAFSNGPPSAALIPGGLPTSNGPPVVSEALKKPPLLNHKLNVTEMAAVRQLITGYRESAAFLLRSADELEHLLQIQPKL